MHGLDPVASEECTTSAQRVRLTPLRRLRVPAKRFKYRHCVVQAQLGALNSWFHLCHGTESVAGIQLPFVATSLINVEHMSMTVDMNVEDVLSQCGLEQCALEGDGLPHLEQDEQFKSTFEPVSLIASSEHDLGKGSLHFTTKCAPPSRNGVSACEHTGTPSWTIHAGDSPSVERVPVVHRTTHKKSAHTYCTECRQPAAEGGAHVMICYPSARSNVMQNMTMEVSEKDRCIHRGGRSEQASGRATHNRCTRAGA